MVYNLQFSWDCLVEIVLFHRLAFHARRHQENKMRNVCSFKVLFLTIVILVTFAGLSRAITFSGKVSDTGGGGVFGATVAVEDNPAISTTTLSDGTFSLSGLPAATDFILRVSKSGYQPVY